MSDEKVESGTIEDFNEWMKQLIFPGELEEFVHVIKEFNTQDEKYIDVRLYTESYRYKFLVIERDPEKGPSYLGCQVNARKPRAGEDWTRGNDLRDGPITKETWNKIVRDIVKYELVRLSPYRKPDTRPDRR